MNFRPTREPSDGPGGQRSLLTALTGEVAAGGEMPVRI